MKLIAVDLDGTLLGGTTGTYGCKPAGLQALQEAARAGIRIAIATGRELAFILDLLRREGVVPAETGWPHVIVSEERFVHYRDASGEYVPDAAWNEAVERAERSRFGEIAVGLSALLAGELRQIAERVRRVEPSKEERRGFVEIVFDSAALARSALPILAAWLAQNGLPYCPVRNVAGIAIRHETVGKGPVLAEVCRTLGIAPAEALVIGDSGNDLSMLAGGFGFAAAVPGNAEDEVKSQVARIGGYIAEGSYGDGVAEAVLRLLPRAEA